MIEWMRSNQRVALVVGLTVAAPMCLLLYVLLSLWSSGSGYQQEIDRLEPRIARYMGAKASEGELLAAASVVDTRILKLVYPASESIGTVSASLQQQVRSIMAAAGMVVTDSRIESSRREGVFDVMGLTVSVSGSMESFDRALEGVAAYSPLLLVQRVDIDPAPLSRSRNTKNTAKQTLKVRLHFLALRATQ